MTRGWGSHVLEGELSQKRTSIRKQEKKFSRLNTYREGQPSNQKDKSLG